MNISQAVVAVEIILIVGYLYILSWHAEPIIIEKNRGNYFIRKYILKLLIPCLAWMTVPFIMVYIGIKLKILSEDSILNSFETSVLMITAVVLFVIYECLRWPNNKLYLWKWLVKGVLVLLNIVYIQNEIRNGYFKLDNYKLMIASCNFILWYIICISHEYRGRIEQSSLHQRAVIDIPRKTYKELFSIRKNEVKNLYYKIHSQNDGEPFAIMIKGKWGSGKTSLMNGFKDEYGSEFDFIDVNVGYTCDIGSVLGNIDKSFQNIFEEQLFFYNDSNKSIWNYFKLLKELTNGIYEKSLDKIIEKISSRESFTEAKNSINTLLDEYGRLTGKRIIIVIDDLERCPSQNLKNVFAVLIEAFKLNNCISVLLCDYEQLTDRVDGGKDYLDKYINKSITLQMVEQSEQVKELLENIDIPHKTKFIEDLIEIDKELRNLKEDDILTNDLDNSRYKTFLNKEDYTRVYRLPRTAVRLINSIEEKLVLLTHNIFEEDIANLEDEWIKGVTFVSFIEHVMPEVYDEIVVEENITTFKARNDDEDINTNHHYRYLVFKRLFRGIDESIFASVIYNTKEYINFENDRAVTIKEWNDNSLKVEKLESYLQFVNSNSDLLRIVDFMDKVEYCQKQDFDIKVINILSNHFGNYFKIDENAAELCRKTKELFEIANSRWNNEIIDYTDALEVRDVNGNLKASEDKINNIITYDCEEVMTNALRQMEKLKTQTISEFDQIRTNNSAYESFYKIKKLLFPEISVAESNRYINSSEEYLREFDLYIEAIRDYLVSYEKENPSLSKMDEYLHYKNQLEICLDIITIMKDDFSKSKLIRNPERDIILGLFNGEKVAQSNQAALTIEIAKVIDNLEEETLKKKWKYILSIVDIGISDLRQALITNEGLNEYYMDMLQSCLEIYNKYKSIIDKKEFSEYYKMGVDLIKLEELSKANDKKI